VGDFTVQGVHEWTIRADAVPLVPLPPPFEGADTDTARRPRDVGKHNRGFAVLCFASHSACDAALNALQALPPGAVTLHDGDGVVVPDVQLRVERARDTSAPGRLYLREDIDRKAEEEAAAVAAQDAKRAARAPHRRRQKERDRTARDARLTSALLRAAGRSDDAIEPQSVESLWKSAYSGWRDATHAQRVLGAIDWDTNMPADLDPCQGGGLGLTPRGLRKRQQVESFLAVLRALLPQLAAELGRPVIIHDYGCGTGNLCLPLCATLLDCNFIAVDAKQESIARCADRAAKAGLTNLTCYHGDIRDAALVSPDIALGLHVCGSGTDAVLDVATSSRAVFCISPCCVGKLNMASSTMQNAANPKSRLIRARLPPELSDDYACLAQAADFAGDSNVSGYDTHSRAGALPRAAKTAVEVDRGVGAAEKGYDVRLIKLLHPESCVRNDVLVGWPADKRLVGDAVGQLLAKPVASVVPMDADDASVTQKVHNMYTSTWKSVTRAA